jgi:prepilin signal peptidase PulO-like enzyme (type II secretory pathway)
VRWIGFELYGWDPIKIVGPFIPVVVLVAVLFLAFFRKNKTSRQLITAMLLAISVYFLVSTTVHPWYVATPLLLCLFTRYRFPILWSGMVFLSYSAYGESGFSENLWMVALEYSMVIGFAVWEIFRSPQQATVRYDI